MKASIVRIGNSRGIRLPKTVLDQCHFDDAVEIEIEGNRLIVRSTRHPRSGWDEAFREMKHHGDDALLDAEFKPASKFDEVEWEW